ncbi:MAG: acetyl-CoA carboxylase, carboxyltransferase subunit beta [Clostridia bacterium]|nr:acetyl-CoA carboxylase, carboxyltransferase subunit beta [Clostridia bacterium]
MANVFTSFIKNFTDRPQTDIDSLIKHTENVNLVCKGCNGEFSKHQLLKSNNMVCPKCGKYFRMGGKERIKWLCDKKSCEFMFDDFESTDFLEFPGYADKLDKSRKSTGEKDAVVVGTAALGGYPFAFFVMDSRFMMASMGSVLGEKITSIFEYAEKHHLPVIGFTASGGARMQEGIISLMQMAKVSGAVKRHSTAGNLYITVLTDPTTGGCTASFAMQGDIILAEPKALVGFAGRRVVEQTTKSKLPDNFQSAEFLLENGFVDAIIPRDKLRESLINLLDIHAGRSADA